MNVIFALFGIVYSKNYFYLAKIFVFCQIKVAANYKLNRSLGLNRILSSNFLWLISVKHVNLTEDSVICKKKHVLIKEMFTNRISICLAQQA